MDLFTVLVHQWWGQAYLSINDTQHLPNSTNLRIRIMQQLNVTLTIASAMSHVMPILMDPRM